MQWITDTISNFGYLGIFLLMVLEGIYPPLPSEFIMPLAGLTAAKGQMSLLGVILAGTSGSMVSAVIIYLVCRSLRLDFVRQFIIKKGKYFFISVESLDLAVMKFFKHSKVSVFICRLVPGVRSLISIPAGLFQMSLPDFILWSSLGTLIWTTVLAVIGFISKDHLMKFFS